MKTFSQGELFSGMSTVSVKKNSMEYFLPVLPGWLMSLCRYLTVRNVQMLKCNLKLVKSLA